jgi:hypothetical protein
MSETIHDVLAREATEAEARAEQMDALPSPQRAWATFSWSPATACAGVGRARPATMAAVCEALSVAVDCRAAIP